MTASLLDDIDVNKQVHSQASDWCKNDKHDLFESFVDLNEWLDSDEGYEVRLKFNLTSLGKPSRALYAGDRELYKQIFKDYREQRYLEILSEAFFKETFANGEHWYERNRERFEQLMTCLLEGQVVPFIGAGISVAAGFPTWKDHLRQQGRTAGIDSARIETLLSAGKFEDVLQEIEAIRGRDTFIQEIRDAFSKTGKITDTILRITDLFEDTLITTNYDRTIELAFDTGKNEKTQIIGAHNALEKPDLVKTTIYKLHGSIEKPVDCILSKNQYNSAYGLNGIDLTLPIPKLLSYHYKTSSLLFLGCSLSSDRTMQVFKAVKDQMGDTDRPQHFSIEQAPETEEELITRNSYLLSYGITAIWFERGYYERVENILRHLRNEIRYRRGSSESASVPKVQENRPEKSASSGGVLDKLLKPISKLASWFTA